MSEPFFHVDGDDFLPTLLCQGPWDPGSAHGGPPSALLVRAIEQHEPDDSLVIGRVLLDLVRAVPLAPLRITTDDHAARPPGADRGGDDDRRRRHRAGAGPGAADPAGARRAWRGRRRPSSHRRSPGPTGRRATVVVGETDGPRVGIMLGVDVRPVTGAFLVPGPATAWFRLIAPLVADEDPTPVQRAMVAADFGNGISQVLGPEFVFINPDLVVHFERAPVRRMDRARRHHPDDRRRGRARRGHALRHDRPHRPERAVAVRRASSAGLTRIARQPAAIRSARRWRWT